MAELMKLLESSGSFKSDLMQKYLNSAQFGSSVTSPPSSLNSSFDTLDTHSTSLPENSATINMNDNQTIQHTRENLNENTNSKAYNMNANKNNVNVGTTVNSLANMNLNANSASLRQTEPTGARPDVTDINVNRSTDVSRIISEVRKKPTDARRLFIANVIDTSVGAHMTTTINTHANVAAANQRIEKEHDNSSNNSSNLWQHFMGAMVPEITKVIKFCTKLPGFPEIEQEDKICLIKQGCFEVMVARFCILIDNVKEELMDPTLKMKAPRSLVQGMPMGPFLDQFFTVASQFNPVGLTDGEIGLYTAALMFCAEREGLKNREAVKVMYQLFLQALYLLLKQNHSDADEKFTTLINMVPVFHKINEDHLKFIRMIKMKNPAEYEKKFPPLHKELFDIA